MRRITLILLGLALLAAPVYAQETTSGTLEGIVLDEGGDPIVDAVITAMGPQGIRTAVTDARGRYVLRGLSTGDYNVKCEAAGYGTIVQSEVEMFIGRRTQLPFTLAEGVTEEVTVTSEAPLVDMKSTGAGESVKIDDFAPYVPLGRNLTAIYTIAPGVSDGGDPVLGSTNSSISGSSGLENTYFVDGVNITNNGYGAIGSYSIVYGSLGTGVTYDFLEEVQVKTGGFEAEFGQASGGIVNTVVRSGTNQFGLDVAWYEDPVSLEGSRNDRQDSPNIANQIESARRDIVLAVSGPIVKDKLFYFAAYNPITIDQDFKLTSGDSTNDYFLQDTNSDGFICDSTGAGFCFDQAGTATVPNTGQAADTPSNFGVGNTVSGGRLPTSVTRTREIDNYAAKLSWFATPNHKFEVTAFGDPSTGEVGPQNPTAFLRALADPIVNADPATSSTGLDWGGDQLALKYQGVWTSNFFTELQYSTKENNFDETGTGTTFRAFFDVENNNTFGGAGFYEELSDNSDQIKFKNTHVLGPVELSYGYQWEDIEWAQPRLRSGPTYTSFVPNMITMDDGMGVGNFISGFDTAVCADPTNTADPACYTRIASSTGASVSIFNTLSDPANEYSQVTRSLWTDVGEPTTSEAQDAFLQINWDIIPQLTMNIGARWTSQELTGSGNQTLPIGVGVDGRTIGNTSTTLVGQTYKFDSEIAPRLGIAWDVMNNGRHKLFANYAEYYNRVPNDLAVRAFSNEAGTTAENFLDPGLTMPVSVNTVQGAGTCAIDTNGDGAADGTSDCHLVPQNGLAGGGSIILDGTQWDPNSDVNAALGGLYTLTDANKATALPFTEEILLGYAFEINDYSSFEVRYIDRALGTVLEDIQFASNEQTWNLFFGASGGSGALSDPFPGAGTGAFGAYVFANPGGNVNSTLFPDPVRDYSAWEVAYKRRFHNGWLAYVNYRYADLSGNYEGSFRNDNGQSDPFLTSLFDFPAASAVDTNLLSDANGDGDPTNDFNTSEGVFQTSDTLAGQYISGPLNTERKNIFNGFLSKQFDFGLNVGGRINVQTGQPRAPLYAHPTYRNSGEIPGANAVYWWWVNVDTTGDGLADSTDFYQDPDPTLPAIPAGSTSQTGAVVAPTALGAGDEILSGPRLYSYDVVQRDFFGENPSLFTFDLSFSYDLSLRGGKSSLTFLMDVFNIFNENGAIRFDNAVETRPGNPNVDYLKAQGFQAPRNVRLGIRYSF